VNKTDLVAKKTKKARPSHSKGQLAVIEHTHIAHKHAADAEATAVMNFSDCLNLHVLSHGTTLNGGLEGRVAK